MSIKTSAQLEKLKSIGKVVRKTLAHNPEYVWAVVRQPAI